MHAWTLCVLQRAKGIDLPLVGNFNLVYTFALDSTPSASKKILQLSSPFCEHTFQKFARFFYTVGFDDSNIKSKEYITQLVKELESLNKGVI